MTDSGFSQLPPGGRAHDSAAAPARAELSLQIESVSGNLVSLRRAVQVQAIVTRISRDNVATLRTDSGEEINVRLRGRVNLAEGQRVIVDLPPGSPPRQAVVRSAPATPAQPVPPAPQGPSPNDPVVQGSTIPSRPDSSPPRAVPQAVIPPDIRAIIDDLAPQVAPARPATPPAAALPPDAIFRLTPLPVMPSAEALLPLPVPQPAQPTIEAFKILAARVILTTPGDLSALPQRPQPATAIPPQILPQAGAPALRAIIDNAITPAPFSVAVAATTAPPITTAFPQGLLQGQTVPLAGDPPFAPVVPAINQALTPPRLDARVVATDPAASILFRGTGEKAVMPQNDGPRPSLLSTQAGPVTLQASVIGTTPQHQPVLSVSWPGTSEEVPYLLQFPTTALPAGTQVALLPHLMPQAGTATPALAPYMPTPAITLLSGWAWPVFDDALESAAAQMMLPSVTAQPLAKILPNPGTPQQMANAVLFFVAAVRSGDVGGWMGEKTINALKRDGGRGAEILARLARDIGGLSKMMTEPVSQDWRAISLPFLWQDDVQKVNLYYRHQGGEKDENKKEQDGRSTRFIFDLNLSNMGDVQLDGLMKDKRLDLILRTGTPFAHAMQVEMRQKYLDVLEAGRLTGDLAFQTRKDQWIRVDARQTQLKTSV